jgi:hypothetical protein
LNAKTQRIRVFESLERNAKVFAEFAERLRQDFAGFAGGFCQNFAGFAGGFCHPLRTPTIAIKFSKTLRLCVQKRKLNYF